jgi:hypothetical protein
MSPKKISDIVIMAEGQTVDAEDVGETQHIVCDKLTVLELQFFGTEGKSLRLDIGELQGLNQHEVARRLRRLARAVDAFGQNQDRAVMLQKAAA